MILRLAPAGLVVLEALEKFAVALVHRLGDFIEQAGAVRMPQVRMREFDLDAVPRVEHTIGHTEKR